VEFESPHPRLPRACGLAIGGRLEGVLCGRDGDGYALADHGWVRANGSIQMLGNEKCICCPNRLASLDLLWRVRSRQLQQRRRSDGHVVRIRLLRRVPARRFPGPLVQGPGWSASPASLLALRSCPWRRMGTPHPRLALSSRIAQAGGILVRGTADCQADGLSACRAAPRLADKAPSHRRRVSPPAKLGAVAAR
jgi:hypothetical protein